MHELLEWFTQNGLDDTGSIGVSEEHERESETVIICQCSLCTVGHVDLVTHKAWFE